MSIILGQRLFQPLFMFNNDFLNTFYNKRLKIIFILVDVKVKKTKLIKHTFTTTYNYSYS